MQQASTLQLCSDDVHVCGANYTLSVT